MRNILMHMRLRVHGCAKQVLHMNRLTDLLVCLPHHVSRYDCPVLQPSSSSHSSSAAAAVAAGSSSSSALQPLAALLGGKPLSPSCMNGIVATFNPRRAAQQQQAGANGKLDFRAAASNASVEQV